MTDNELTELVEKIFSENGRAMTDEELLKVAEKEAYRKNNSRPFYLKYALPFEGYLFIIIGVWFILAGVDLGGGAFSFFLGALFLILGRYFFPWCTRIFKDSVEKDKAIIYERLKNEQSINDRNKDKR